MDTTASSGQDAEELLKRLSQLPTPIIGDSMERLAGTVHLRPMHSSKRIAGFARTVRVAEGDNLYIHHALNICRPGEVIVVDGGGSATRALIGELMLLFGRSKGLSGFVIDGAVRDAEAFRTHDFPCFARAQTLRGPYKNGPGAVDIPVTIDGMMVHPGDIVVGDEDGVLAISPVEAGRILQIAEEKLAHEARVIREIENGTSDRSWVERRISAI